MPRNVQIQSVLNKTKRRDPWFLDDYTVNPYSGCTFHCLYCYVAGSKYGYNVEDKFSVKQNAVEVLDRQLKNRAAKKQYGIIALSSATDPYLSFEEERGLTRELLQTILKHRFPVHVLTKSDLVLRDLDLISEIESAAILPEDLEGKLIRKSFITFSFSTLDDRVARIFEPGAVPPSRRLAALCETLKRGLCSGVSLMPLLPHISDTGENLETIFRTFGEIGVSYIFPATLTLFGYGPSDGKSEVFQAVEKNYPHLLEKYRKFFSGGCEMPAYYKNALSIKTKELCERYGIRKGILQDSSGPI
ncbi:radical SAM protein [Leptospira gomenensis]|uniref:Radical SAM protein n=1 Tax=Leptospira gomenensis TaxID=2484974 RepID=A0A5F1YFZ5_9LEPT|nr:radical SAM protein [Leptospira gomenensis]TGK39250.1 radical SAM protein [Leptospira gomenensis]TGK44004.1 radical SAM protein [Leptospira gomenensis]TGK48920.1 radical SAM protein [Leptospira gomenensis]TGK54630.1 radical SAM protein [Leptospira gomenensis]